MMELDEEGEHKKGDGLTYMKATTLNTRDPSTFIVKAVAFLATGVDKSISWVYYCIL